MMIFNRLLVLFFAIAITSDINLAELNDFEYSAPLGWKFHSHQRIELKHSFIPIFENAKCLDGTMFSGKVKNALQCKLKCANDWGCHVYAYWRERHWCEMYPSCFLVEEDGNNLISVFRRMHECDYVLNEYLVTISAEFPGNIVKSSGPGRNLHCKCTTAGWMFCAIFVVEASPEAAVIQQRLDRNRPKEELEPFVVMLSQSGSNVTPVCYLSRDRLITDSGRKTSVAAEIEVMNYQSCMLLSQCIEGTPASEAGPSLQGECPIRKFRFRPGDPVYILNSDISNVLAGKPVPCISLAGMRTYAARASGAGFMDPFNRNKQGHPLYVRRDYTVFIAFDDTMRASGICQDPLEPEEKQKPKRRGGKKSKGSRGSSQLPGPSSDDLGSNLSGPSSSEQSELPHSTNKAESLPTEEAGPSTSTYQDAMYSRSILKSDSDPSYSSESEAPELAADVSNTPYTELSPQELQGPGWTTVKSRQEKKKTLPTDMANPGLAESPSRSPSKQPTAHSMLIVRSSDAVGPTYVWSFDVSNSPESSHPAEPQEGPSGDNPKPERKSPVKRMYRARPLPKLRQPQGSSPNSRSPRSETSTDKLAQDMIDKGTMTDPGPSQVDEGTMTNALRLKDLLSEMENQVVLKGDENESEEHVGVGLQRILPSKTFLHVFIIFTFTLLFTFYIKHAQVRETFHDQNVYVEFLKL